MNNSINNNNNNDNSEYDSYNPVQYETNIKKEKKVKYEYMELLVATPLLALIKFIPNNRVMFGVFSVTLGGAIIHGTAKMLKSFGGQEDEE